MEISDRAFRRLSVVFDGGSGLIFRTSKDSLDACFMTVHHNYMSAPNKGEQTFEKSILEPLSGELIDLRNYDCMCIYSSVMQDLVVILIKNIPSDFLLMLDVYSGSFKSSVVFGYPRERRKADYKLQFFRSSERRSGSKKEDDFTYEVYTPANLSTNGSTDIESNKGISGGGVVVLGNDDKYHLAGIVKQVIPYGNFVYTDISGLLATINRQDFINEKIHHYKNQAFIECNIKPEDLDLANIKASILESGNVIFDDYSQSIPDSEFIDSVSKAVDKKYRKITDTKKELSNFYVFSGIVHHENEEFGKSTTAFKRAIRLYESNKYIFNQAYTDRKNSKKISNQALKDHVESLKESSKREQDETKHEEDQGKIKRKLEEILIYHKLNDLEKSTYFEDMDDTVKKELIPLCKQYSDFDVQELAIEVSYFLSTLYLHFQMRNEAKEKCVEVLGLFDSFPQKENVLYAIKCHLILTVKLSPIVNYECVRKSYYIARKGVPENHSFEQLINCILSILDAYLDHTNEKGKLDEATINEAFSPLGSVLQKSTNKENYEARIALKRLERINQLDDRYNGCNRRELIDELDSLKGKYHDLRASVKLTKEKPHHQKTDSSKFFVDKIAKLLKEFKEIFISPK